MLNTTSPINAAAASNIVMTVASRGQLLRRGDAITAAPRPMPRMNAISTIANACNDAPKIKLKQRDANTSSPIETPPVNATSRQPQRNNAAFAAGVSVAGLLDGAAV